jgi:hypothetical protein
MKVLTGKLTHKPVKQLLALALALARFSNKTNYISY